MGTNIILKMFHRPQSLAMVLQLASRIIPYFDMYYEEKEAGHSTTEPW